MFIVEKKFRFEASHVLPFHDGKCKRMHGHSWVGTVAVYGAELIKDGPKRGMVMDFGEISSAISPLVECYLDHYHLNDTLHHFGIVNPTSEEIARWMFRQLYEVRPNRQNLPTLAYVRIEETCTSAASYFGNQDKAAWLQEVNPVSQAQTVQNPHNHTSMSQRTSSFHRIPDEGTSGSK